MNNITTYQDVLQEKQRLTLLLAERGMLVKAEFAEIKLKLKPLTNIVDVVEKITSKDTRNPLINAGIDIGVNLLLKNVVLRNAGWIMKLLMPALVKNYLSHETSEVESVYTKIKGFFKKQFKQHQQA